MWRNLGETSNNEIQLTQIVKNVFEVDAPVSNFADGFEYFIEMQAREKTFSCPAMANENNCSVVVF